MNRDEIEKLLKTRSFTNEHHRLRANLLVASNYLTDEVKAFLEPFEITQKQFNILRILRGMGEQVPTVYEIRTRMIDKMSDTSRLVDRLIAKGLVEKYQCPHDGRVMRAKITDEGLLLLQRIDQNIEQLDAITNNLTDHEAKVLNQLLTKLYSQTK